MDQGLPPHLPLSSKLDCLLFYCDYKMYLQKQGYKEHKFNKNTINLSKREVILDKNLKHTSLIICGILTTPA